jgi:hypothetical protein
MTHLTAYDKDVAVAYGELIQTVLRLRSGPLDKDMRYAAMRVATGLCGGACGAAAKRLKRAVVLEALLEAKEGGLDITPTVAMRIFVRLIGRGVDNRATLQCFATPGRTAADKSALKADDLVALDSQLDALLLAMVEPMATIKKAHFDHYKAATKN